MFREDVTLPEGLLFPEVLTPQAVVGLVGTTPSRDVIAVDLEGKTLWSRQLNEPCQMGVVKNDLVWLFESHAIVALDLDGRGVRRIHPRLEQEERVGSIAATENAIIISLYREKPHAKHGLSPRVLRLSLDGDETGPNACL